MSFNADLFENIKPSETRKESLNDSAAQSNPSELLNNASTVAQALAAESRSESSPLKQEDSEQGVKKTSGRPGRPRTGKMERVMCYFPKELVEDMNHFSEKEMISRNAFIITCILKHVRELKKEERSENRD